MADKKTFLREGAFYQATDKALNNDMEMTSIVNNDDPIHPFVEAPAANAGGGGGGVETVTGDLVDNADPLNPVVNLPYKVYIALVSVYISDVSKNQTSGSLIVGHVYYLVDGDFNPGDDFSNVGGEPPYFTATDTTPTDWTNGTLLRDITPTVELIDNTIDAGNITATLSRSYNYDNVLDIISNNKFTNPDIIVGTPILNQQWQDVGTGAVSYRLLYLQVESTDSRSRYRLYNTNNPADPFDATIRIEIRVYP